MNLNIQRSYEFNLPDFFNLSQVEVPDESSLCPDHSRQNMSVSRPSQTEGTYVQTFVRSKSFFRSSIVYGTRLYPDIYAFKITFCQNLVRS